MIDERAETQPADFIANLREIAQTLSAAWDVDTTLDLVARKTTQVMHVDSCSIYLLEPSGDTFHIQTAVNIPEGAKLTFNIRGIPLTFTANTLEADGKSHPLDNQIKTIEILIDRASIETFLNHGELSSTRFILPRENGLSLKAEGNSVQIQFLTVHTLRSIWDEKIARHH